jgi:hypothetical protein
MTEQSTAGDDAPTVAVIGAEGDFAAEALRLRMKAQRQYAEMALTTLSQIAQGGEASAVQVGAIRELLEQVLGRPMPPLALPASQGEEMGVHIKSLGEKLDRIVDGRAAAAAEGAE